MPHLPAVHKDRGLHLPLLQEQTVTRAVVAKLREACGACLEPAALLPAARSAVAEAHGGENPTAEIRALRAKIGRLTTVLDRMYLDQLSACWLRRILHGSTGRPARSAAHWSGV